MKFPSGIRNTWRVHEDTLAHWHILLVMNNHVRHDLAIKKDCANVGSTSIKYVHSAPWAGFGLLQLSIKLLALIAKVDRLVMGVVTEQVGCSPIDWGHRC